MLVWIPQPGLTHSLKAQLHMTMSLSCEYYHVGRTQLYYRISSACATCDYAKGAAGPGCLDWINTKHRCAEGGRFKAPLHLCIMLCIADRTRSAFEPSDVHVHVHVHDMYMCGTPSRVACTCSELWSKACVATTFTPRNANP